MEPALPIAGLVTGHVYRLRSRNLAFGAYNGETFCGIRTKFDRRFLDREDHWDKEPRTNRGMLGTASPVEDLGPLPAGISPSWSLGAACHATGRAISWRGDILSTHVPGGNWVYADTGKPIPAYPASYAVVVENTALFDYLLSLEPAGTAP